MKLLLQRRKKVGADASPEDTSYLLISVESGSKRPKGTANTVDDDGILEDIVVTSTSAATRREDKTRDVNAFFEEAQLVTIGDGSKKRYRICKNCP
jgi:hypothetical protein